MGGSTWADRRVWTAKAAGFALLCAVLGCSGAVKRGDSISPEALVDRLEPAGTTLIVDVRTPEEYAAGHIPGAINLPHELVEDRVDLLGEDRGRDVVVYCERGFRAAKAESVLRDLGFSSVLHLEGDMSGWRKQGLPCAGC